LLRKPGREASLPSRELCKKKKKFFFLNFVEGGSEMFFFGPAANAATSKGTLFSGFLPTFLKRGERKSLKIFEIFFTKSGGGAKRRPIKKPR
jgi:hypothetical protein